MLEENVTIRCRQQDVNIVRVSIFRHSFFFKILNVKLSFDMTFISTGSYG